MFWSPSLRLRSEPDREGPSWVRYSSQLRTFLHIFPRSASVRYSQFTILFCLCRYVWRSLCPTHFSSYLTTFSVQQGRTTANAFRIAWSDHGQTWWLYLCILHSSAWKYQSYSRSIPRSERPSRLLKDHCTSTYNACRLSRSTQYSRSALPNYNSILHYLD